MRKDLGAARYVNSPWKRGGIGLRKGTCRVVGFVEGSWLAKMYEWFGVGAYIFINTFGELKCRYVVFQTNWKPVSDCALIVLRLLYIHMDQLEILYVRVRTIYNYFNNKYFILFIFYMFSCYMVNWFYIVS